MAGEGLSSEGYASIVKFRGDFAIRIKCFHVEHSVATLQSHRENQIRGLIASGTNCDRLCVSNGAVEQSTALCTLNRVIENVSENILPCSVTSFSTMIDYTTISYKASL